jgi:ssDNA-binding Zn-finger/Zn-ribbon topoisomerase 1
MATSSKGSSSKVPTAKGKALSDMLKEELVDLLCRKSSSITKGEAQKMTRKRLYLLLKCLENENKQTEESFLPKGYKNFCKNRLILLHRELIGTHIDGTRTRCEHVVTEELVMRLELWNSEREEASELDGPNSETAEAEPKGLRPFCPECRRPMIMRLNRLDHRPFWGCATFPVCRETLPYTVNGHPTAVIQQYMAGQSSSETTPLRTKGKRTERSSKRSASSEQESASSTGGYQRVDPEEYDLRAQDVVSEEELEMPGDSQSPEMVYAKISKEELKMIRESRLHK